ncbi:hypothetical protein AGMMS49992_15580 [Clostridia bacterium]|nr:hypothetical protein AGMMS49992_15580 [Clostridia bacterium]
MMFTMIKKLATDAPAVICSNSHSIFNYFGWPSVTRLPDGALAMVTSGFRLDHICPFGKGVISYSYDDGKSWTLPAVIFDTPLDDRDSGITCFGEKSVIVTSFNNTLKQQHIWNDRTRSDAEAWQNKRKLIDAYLDCAEAQGNEDQYLGSTYRISNDGGYTFGPIRRVPVTAPHGPARMNDGTLIYVGRKFSSNNKFDPNEKHHLACYHLDLNGDYEFLSEIDNISVDGEMLESCEPHTIQLPSGRILVHIRVQLRGSYFTVYQSESDDGGRTFTSPHALLDKKGGSPAHILRCSDGLLISVYGYREAPYGIRAMFSWDDGETWDTDYVLSDDGLSGDLGYPASVELSDSRILTVYYQNIGGECVIRQQVWDRPSKA